MEKNHINLQDAIANLPLHEPTEQVWGKICEQLDAAPLQAALQQLPEYTPQDHLWEVIDKNLSTKQRIKWRLPIAAMLAIAVGLGLVWITSKSQPVKFSQELADIRLQTDPIADADKHFAQLTAYCAGNALVCSSQKYQDLKAEYEKLISASNHLRNAIGAYNTSPDLVHQFSEVEKQKTDILNRMSKII